MNRKGQDRCLREQERERERQTDGRINRIRKKGVTDASRGWDQFRLVSRRVCLSVSALGSFGFGIGTDLMGREGIL